MARTIRKSGVKEVPLSEVKDDLSRYLREAETQEIVITRHGRPVAQIGPAPAGHRKARLGGMKDRIRLLPGWNAPIDPDRFLEGDL